MHCRGIEHLRVTSTPIRESIPPWSRSGALPSDPVEQNRVWYRLYKTVEDNPAVSQVHRDFLLTRDYTGLALLFLLIYGGVGYYSIPSLKIATIYAGILVIQLVVVQQAALHYGVRFVTSVLARVIGNPETPNPAAQVA
jgi:hypothetical protein